MALDFCPLQIQKDKTQIKVFQDNSLTPCWDIGHWIKKLATVSMATTSGRRNFVTSLVMLECFISENFVKILFVVVELLSKRIQISVLYWHLENLPSLAPSGVHFCNTLPVFGSFQSLLNYSRKSITPRKLCSEQELYLSFRRTHSLSASSLKVSAKSCLLFKRYKWKKVKLVPHTKLRLFLISINNC